MGGFVIAIDGPAGAGKTTLAIGVARRLGFHYLDTGAMYRAITLKLLKAGIISDRSRWMDCLESTALYISTDPSKIEIRLDGEDVTSEIRTLDVDKNVSQVSADKEIREWMKRRQQEIADGKKIVCEGRDMATVVFPDAKLKIYLDADSSERVRRREKQLVELGATANTEKVKENIAFRDQYDSSREVAPLTRADDAMVIDNTQLSITDEIEIVVQEVMGRLAE